MSPQAVITARPSTAMPCLRGLLRCRRCGRKLTVRYTGQKHNIPRYSCTRGWLDNGEPRCIAFGGLRVDDAIEEMLLQVVEPGAIAAAVEAEARQAERRDHAREMLVRDLEAARFAADRAFRQYDATDPTNRLVAAELEVRWNAALADVAGIEAKIVEHDATAPPCEELSPASFATLADDLKDLWAAPTTDARLKKRIVRTVIREVVANIDEDASEIVLTVHWAGGVHTERRLPKRRRGQRNSTAPDIIEAVRLLVRIAGDDLIAGLLNRNGLVTGNGNRWTRERVTSLRSHHRIPVHRPAADGIEPWLNLTRAARLLHITPKTLRRAAENGEIDAVHPLADGPWIFSRPVLEGEAAKSPCRARQITARTPHGTASRSTKPLPFNGIDRWVVVMPDCTMNNPHQRLHSGPCSTTTIPWRVQAWSARPSGTRCDEALLTGGHHSPVFCMLFHGSAGSSGSPFCSSSMEIPSGERMKAMLPSRGGRLIVTPLSRNPAQAS